MKARVKADGRIIEVEKAMIGYAECAVANINGFPAQNFYSEKELEFLPDTPEKVIEGWVARDEDGALNLFDREPERIAECAWTYYPGHTLGLSLPKESFPEVTWDCEPKRVRITITPMEE